MNLPQQRANNNGPRTDVPLQESPNVVAPESNFFSSGSLAPNPLENVDLSLNFGLSRQGATISSAVIPSSNVASSVHGSNSNSANIPRKRGLPDHASGEFHQGESSNAGQETGEIKRPALESQVRANDNVNPSPPPLPLMQQQHQFLRGRHVNPNNAGTHFAPPHARPNGMTIPNQRRGSNALIPSQANFPFSGASTHSQPSHSVRHPSFHSSSFMSSSSSSVNNLSVRNALHSISSPCPHERVDIMVPFYEHRSNMLGPVVTSVGNNFPTYQPNRSYVDSNRDTARRGLPFVLPHQFEPPEPEPLQLLPGIVGNGGRVSNTRANTYHPLTDHGSSSTWVPPLGPREMPHSAAASSSDTQNPHLSRPIPQFPSLEALRLPNEVCSIPFTFP